MRFVLAAWMVVTLAAASYADRITLIYGDVLEGTVLSETDKTVTFQGPFGERVLMKSDIREITKGGASGPEPGSPWNEQPAAPADSRPLPAGSWPSANPPASALPSAPPATSIAAPAALPPANTLPPRDAPLIQEPPPVVSAPPPPPPSPPAWTLPADGQPPSPYDLLRHNAEMQGQWQTLEISYLQRAFSQAGSFETRYIARIIPPDYMRAKLVTPIQPSNQFPQGGEVEYDMYRSRGTLWQIAKVPNQPVQYLQMDASRVERQAAANSVDSFQKGFSGVGLDEERLQILARNSTVLGSEVTEGHECWVLETRYAPEVIDSHVRRSPLESQQVVRQQLTQIGNIRNWVGKQDLIQWRMESFAPNGSPMLAMAVLSVKPNAPLDPQELRMKVPKGTVWVDITDMISGKMAEMLGQGGQPGAAPQTGASQQGAWPQQQQAAPVMQQQPVYQQQAAPASAFTPAQPQSYSYPQQGQVQQQGYNYQLQSQPQAQPMMQQQYQPQAQPYAQPAPGGAFQQTYVQQGPPGSPMMMQQPQQQQQPGGGGNFLSRLFGGGRSAQPQQMPSQFGGTTPGGNPTMMVPMVNGQPQFPQQR